MDRRVLMALAGGFAMAACVQVPLAPGAGEVAITRNPADVAGCKPVGNIDGKNITDGIDVPITPQMQNQAVGLGGNRVLDTSVGLRPAGVVYKC